VQNTSVIRLIDCLETLVETARQHSADCAGDTCWARRSGLTAAFVAQTETPQVRPPPFSRDLQCFVANKSSSISYADFA
jgi:hypothetical protein